MYLVLESRYKAFYQAPSFYFQFVFTFLCVCLIWFNFQFYQNVPALFLQGTYLEAVSGLPCFIFQARLNMKEQVINCFAI